MAGGNPCPPCPCNLRLGLFSWVSCGWLLQGDWTSGYLVETFDPDNNHYHPRAAIRSEIRDHWSCSGSFGRNPDSPGHQFGVGDSICECYDHGYLRGIEILPDCGPGHGSNRKSTRLNSSHVEISYAVFCLK